MKETRRSWRASPGDSATRSQRCASPYGCQRRGNSDRSASPFWVTTPSPGTRALANPSRGRWNELCDCSTLWLGSTSPRPIAPPRAGSALRALGLPRGTARGDDRGGAASGCARRRAGGTRDPAAPQRMAADVPGLDRRSEQQLSECDAAPRRRRTLSTGPWEKKLGLRQLRDALAERVRLGSVREGEALGILETRSSPPRSGASSRRAGEPDLSPRSRRVATLTAGFGPPAALNV